MSDLKIKVTRRGYAWETTLSAYLNRKLAEGEPLSQLLRNVYDKLRDGAKKVTYQTLGVADFIEVR